MPMPSALEIARQATLKPVAEIAEDIGIPPWLIEPYGEFVAKIGLGAIEALAGGHRRTARPGRRRGLPCRDRRAPPADRDARRARGAR